MKRLMGWQRSLALVLIGVFALSAATTGTAAWVDLSQHKTNIAGGGGPPQPANALLQKYETDTEAPVPGATFALYRQNAGGTANLIDTFITGPDGQALASALEPGEYCWQELHAPAGYLPEIEDGQAKKYPFTVPAQGGAPAYTVAYNARQKASLTVTKTVVGEGADRAFAFTAVIGGKTEMFTLWHGNSVVFEDIPVGTAYEVTEAPVEGYVTGSENHAGVIPAQGVTAAFTNTYAPPQPGGLIVTKAVTGQGADPDRAFEFTAVIGRETQTFTLTHGASKSFDNVPVGTEYAVTEADCEGYTTAQRTRGGTVTMARETVHLVYVNEYGPPEPEKGTLVVTKAVTGSGDHNKAFRFTAAIGGETESFELRHGESKIFTELPAGTAYAVTENSYSEEGYTAGFVPAGSESGIIIGGQTATVTCVNAYRDPRACSLTVIKRLEGPVPDAEKDRAFTFLLEAEGRAPVEFTLQAGGAKSLTLPAGLRYSVQETNLPGGVRLAKVENGAGTTTESPIAAVFTNAYDPETIDIEGEKTWESPGPPTAIELPAGVTIRLKNGSAIVGSAVVTAAGGWRYRFANLPRRDALGTVIPYAIEEERIPGWRPVVTGYNIKNRYQPPVTGEAIEVEKAITGTPPGAVEFKFLLTPINNAPMPERGEIAITGPGKAAFGAIAYDAPGTYIYTITETPGGLPHWSYDASVYTLTVTVGEKEDGRLEAGGALARAGQSVDKALFTNHYSDVPETIQVRVTKAWQGTGEHPQSVRAQLYKDGTAYGGPATLSAANQWTRVWNALEKGHTWTVDEVGVPEGYTKTVSGDAVNGFTITNTKGSPPETADVKVTKVWKGGDENRPAGVAAQLYRDGAATGPPVTLSEANGWTYTWSGLAKGPAWTADEVNAPAGYSKAVTGDAANGFVITNTKRPAPPPGDEIILTGKKTWNHEGSPMDKRPQSITVVIKAAGSIVAQRLITATEHWAWSFKLPKYDAGGKEIKYTVDEALLADYVKTVDGYNLINTYSPGRNTDNPYTPPKTDDSGNPALWLALMGVSFAALAALTIRILPWRNKRGKQHDTKNERYGHLR